MILELIASACMITISFFQVWLLFRQTSSMKKQTEINESLEKLQYWLAAKTTHYPPSHIREAVEKESEKQEKHRKHIDL